MKTKKYIKDVPKLASEYHFEKNVDVDFEKLTHGSHKKLWWICSHGHKWQAKAKDRSRGNGCPYCSNHKACIENCLAKTHPELVSQWSLKNKIKPTEITYGSGVKVWWKCSNHHEWKACVLSRANGGHGCPYCSGHKACKGNCLEDTHPELLREWDFDKNKIKPTEITFGSTKRVWWKCSKGHEWNNTVISQVNNKFSCPYCSNYKVCKDNCLSTTHPKTLKEWNYSKNKIKPDEVTFGSTKKIWWKCKKCKQDWKSTIYNRSKGQGCPYCANKKIYFKNSFYFKSKLLLKEWNYCKNETDPKNIFYSSSKQVWWKCKKGHEWKASILSREKGGNCPYCSNYRACKDNCLSTTHPHLLKEWNNNKNIIKPEEVVAGSKKKVWWKCKKCKWEWESRISHRTRESGCPRCKESKGESKVEKILEDLKIRHKREYKFKKLGRKKFDFALFKKYAKKPYAIIEYHGEQHYIPVRFGGMSLAKAKVNLVSCQKRDKIKKQYCLDNDINYLEIPYTKKDNIEKLIKDFLEKH